MTANKAFEKFSKKMIGEEPLSLRRKGEGAPPEETPDTEEKTAVPAPAQEKPAPRKAPARKAAKAQRVAEEDDEGKVLFTVQLPKSYKRRLDEMKYRMEINYRELIVEAIDLLSSKYRDRLEA